MKRLTILLLVSIVFLLPFVINDAFAETQTIVKLVDEPVTNSDVLQDDDELFFTCEADKTYTVRLTLFTDTDFNDDWKEAWTVPTGTSARILDDVMRMSTTQQMRDATVSNFQNGGNVGDSQHTVGDLIINVGSTTGTCQFQFAQNTAEPSRSAIVLAGSMLQIWQVGADQSPSSLAHTKVVKAVDETVTNDIVPQDDDELFFVATANKVYHMELVVYLGGSAFAEDFRTVWSLPAGATGNVTTSQFESINALSMDDITVEHTHNAGTSDPRHIIFNAFVEMGSTAGTVQFQWAQQTAGGNPTIVKRGSTLLVWEEGTTIATSLQGEQGIQGIQGVAGSAGARGADGASATSPVSNPAPVPDAITQVEFDLLLSEALAELQPVEANIVESAVQTFFEFSVVDVTHDQLVLNSFLGNERLGIRWSSGQDMIVTSAVPASSPFLITFEQFPSVKRGSGAVISTDFILYNLEIPNNPCTAQITADCVQNVRYAIPVTVNGIVNGVEVVDTGTITIDLTEEAFDPILLLILAMFFIPVAGILIQRLRGRSARVPVTQLLK